MKILNFIQIGLNHFWMLVSPYLEFTEKKLNYFIWNLGIPVGKEMIPFLVLLLLGTGIFISIKLSFIQIRWFKHGIDVIRGKYDDPEDDGDINHFQALTTALSATVGIGNIAGVATAIHYGGPGALFWMWITAFFGMALKYAECTLSMNYREFDKDGFASGGPMYYIEKGLGPKFKWLAIFFASCAVISSFGSGNSIQAFTVADSFRTDFHISPIITGIILSIIVGFVIIGGIKRIGSVTSKLAPVMAAIYCFASLIILLLNVDKIPSGLILIVKSAFNPVSQLTGITGGTFLVTLLWGIKRGLFSNEAGQGSAPIAHASAKTDEPAREGVVAMLGPFIDTLVICTMTGLTIIVTGAYKILENGKMLNGSPLTAKSFQIGLAPIFSNGNLVVTFSVFLFAVSTAISWSYYGDRAVQYLLGVKYVKPYKWIYVLVVFLGANVSLKIVWGFGDAALGLMAIPNLFAILLLSGKVKEISDNYASKSWQNEKKS